MTDKQRRFQFYGRRKGHALRRHHLRLMQELLPRLRVEASDIAANPHARKWLEIGFGGGEHLAMQAELNPQVLCVGAEPFVNGVAKLLATVEEKQLGNIRVFDDDVRYLFEGLPDQVFDRIYLLYPDPWPKVRHHKRRFVNAGNLGQIHRLLKPHGRFIFASDIADYVDWTLEHMRAHGGFEGPLGDQRQPPEGWLETRYESKARHAMRETAYLQFRRM